MLSRHLPPLDALKIFEAAVRNESFVLAASELFITASAVSHHVGYGMKVFKEWVANERISGLTRQVFDSVLKN